MTLSPSLDSIKCRSSGRPLWCCASGQSKWQQVGRGRDDGSRKCWSTGAATAIAVLSPDRVFLHLIRLLVLYIEFRRSFIHSVCLLIASQRALLFISFFFILLLLCVLPYRRSRLASRARSAYLPTYGTEQRSNTYRVHMSSSS